MYSEYYLIEVERFKDVIQNDIDEWIYFLKNESIRDDFKSKNIKKVQEKLDILKMSKKERKRYERYLTNLAIEYDQVECAREEGMEEGRKEGREEGIKEGARQKAIAIAKNLLDVLDNQTISEKTGLTIEEVEGLRK